MPFNLDLYPYLKRILEEVYANKIVCKRVVNGAHDSNWVKEYELFYEKQPKSTPYVTRVLFKVDEKRGKKAGFSHIRPITDGSEISETYLIPPKALSPENEVYLKCLDTYNVYGQTVECVPYIMPETIFGMCIHASVWICLKILERRGGTVEKSLCIPTIQNLARGTPYTDKQGLFFVQATRLLRMSRASAFYVINKESPHLTDNQMLMELYAYVESGLPVIIGVDVADLDWWEDADHSYHSLVAIGHTMKENEIDGFVFHDESALPYVALKRDKLLDAWHVPPSSTQPQSYVREMLVAVPPTVSLSFHEVFTQFEELLKVLSEKEITSETTGSLVIRPMLRKSVESAFEAQTPLLLQAFLEMAKKTEIPPYLWVFLLYPPNVDRRDLKNAKGFFARDATAKTEFRFFYFKDEKQAIYQLAQDKIYRRREEHKRRERLQ